MIDNKNVDKLPTTCGVYIFKKNGEYLYVGRSVNIKARVKSHLQNAKIDPKEAALVNATDRVDYLITDSEFKALLLEAELIKEHQPKYNVIWKDDKSFLYIKISLGDEFPKVFLSRKKSDDIKTLYFGPFPSVKTTLQIIREIRKIIPFCMDKKLKSGPCFYAKIGRCSPCPGAIIKEKNGRKRRTLKRIYRQNIYKLIRLLCGKTSLIINDFTRQLKKKIKEKKFEEAMILRDRIFQMQYLEKMSFANNYSYQQSQPELALESLSSFLIPYLDNLKKLNRIECYDISNLAGENATASLVVLTNGLIDKAQYRRFRIKNLKNKNDLLMLEEVFKRRFNRKDQYPSPDLIVVDGGRPQVKLLRAVLKKMKLNIPLIGIAKNPDRLILGKEKLITVKPPNNHLGFNLIKSLRDESHRFAHKYHLLLRKKKMIL